MVRSPRLLATGTLLLALVACQARSTSPVAGHVARTGLGGASADAVEAVATITGKVKLPAGIVSEHGGGILSDRSLGIISERGGGIVSNNSGSVITDHGTGVTGQQAAGRRLLAIDPNAVVVVQGARVQALDGAGVPIEDAAGKPLVAVTDASGAYRFDAPLPPHGVVLQVDLGQHAAARALVSRDWKGAHAVDIDLVSSLTSGFILDRFVSSQADRQATLDKLPDAVEAETRAKATASLASSHVAPPTDLTTDQLDGVVTDLRRHDPGFDAQIVKVRDLLIAAGQSNLGDGRPATQVRLAKVMGLAEGADGSLYLSSSQDGRGWRVGPDGVAHAFAGSGSSNVAQDVVADPRGKPALAARLVDPQLEGLDATDRPLLRDILDVRAPRPRVSRVEADGSLTVLAGELGAHANAGGSVSGLEIVTGAAQALNPPLVFTPDGVPLELQGGALDALAPDGSASGPAVTPSGLVDPARTPDALALAPDGSYLLAYTAAPAHVDRVTAAHGRQTLVTASAGDRLALTPRGETLVWPAGADQVDVTLPDGTAYTLTGTLPAGTLFDRYHLALGNGRALYVATAQDLVYKLQDGKATQVAGLAASSSGNAADASYQRATGLAVTPAGNFFVADEGSHQIFKVADNASTAYAGNGTLGQALPAPGTAALGAALPTLGRLGADAAGNLYVEALPATILVLPVDQLFGPGIAANLGDYVHPRLLKVGMDGQLQVVYDGSQGDLYRWAVTPAGQVYGQLEGASAIDPEIYRLAPGQAPAKAFTLPAVPSDGTIFAAPANGLYVIADRHLSLWSSAGTPTPFPAADAYLAGIDRMRGVNEPELVADGAGRVYVGEPKGNTVTRLDPVTGSHTVIAGVGGQVFTAADVDGGLSLPGQLGLDAVGNLYVLDTNHRQVKRVPASKL